MISSASTRMSDTTSFGEKINTVVDDLRLQPISLGQEADPR